MSARNLRSMRAVIPRPALVRIAVVPGIDVPAHVHLRTAIVTRKVHPQEKAAAVVAEASGTEKIFTDTTPILGRAAPNPLVVLPLRRVILVISLPLMVPLVATLMVPRRLAAVEAAAGVAAPVIDRVAPRPAHRNVSVVAIAPTRQAVPRALYHRQRHRQNRRQPRLHCLRVLPLRFFLRTSTTTRSWPFYGHVSSLLNNSRNVCLSTSA